MTDLRERVAKALMDREAMPIRHTTWWHVAGFIEPLIRAERAAVWEEAAGIAEQAVAKVIDATNFGLLPPEAAPTQYVAMVCDTHGHDLAAIYRARAEEERRG